jgi:uncharacterized protein YlxP (DUF503 family)
MAYFQSMIIGILQATWSIPEANSLKDKRQIIKSMKDRIVARMNVSVAETGKQDVWKGCEFTFVTVAAEKKIVEKRMAKLSEYVRSNPRLVLLDFSTRYL